MSLALLSSALSPLARSSSCLRCCKSAWAFSWSFQKSGALIFSSSSAICLRADSASKIAPHEPNAFLKLGVALLEVFDVFSHVQILHRKLENGKSKLLLLRGAALSSNGGLLQTLSDRDPVPAVQGRSPEALPTQLNTARRTSRRIGHRASARCENRKEHRARREYPSEAWRRSGRRDLPRP